MWARFFNQAPLAPAAEPATSPRVSGAIRQSHRVIAMLFTSTVVANFAAMAFGKPPAWITYSPLPPLFLLMFSGLYMFVLPHMVRRRRNPRN